MKNIALFCSEQPEIDLRGRQRYPRAVPRPRLLDHCDQIAALLAQGYTVAMIVDQLGLTRGVIANRLASMRTALAEQTGETAWLTRKLRTNVQVGQAWGQLEG